MCHSYTRWNNITGINKLQFIFSLDTNFIRTIRPHKFGWLIESDINYKAQYNLKYLCCHLDRWFSTIGDSENNVQHNLTAYKVLE